MKIDKETIILLIQKGFMAGLIYGRSDEYKNSDIDSKMEKVINDTLKLIRYED